MITSDATGAVNIDLKALKETINADGGDLKITEAFKTLKVFTPEQHASILNNHKEALKLSLKDDFYKDHKRDIHGSLEKEIMKKYGMELKPGEDFKTTIDLLALVEAKIKKDNGKEDPEAVKKYTDKIAELNKNIEGMVKKEDHETMQNDFYNTVLDLSVGALHGRIDAEEDKVAQQLNYLKYIFVSEGNKISKKDNSFVVLNKEGQPVVDNTTFKPVSISTFIESLAASNLKLKEGPATGRGGNPNNPDSQNAELLALKDKNSFIDHLRKKNIDMGSEEGMKLYTEWRKVHNIKD